MKIGTDRPAVVGGRWILLFACVLSTCQSISGVACADTVSPEQIVQTIVEGLKARAVAVTSAEGLFVKRERGNSDPRLLAAIKDDMLRSVINEAPHVAQIYWVAEGQKVREDVKYVRPVGLDYYALSSYDGEKSQQWDFGSPNALQKEGKIGEIGETQIWLQLPLNRDIYSYTDPMKDHQLQLIGKQALGGVDTYVVQAVPKAGDTSLRTWWIAPDRGFVIIKFEDKILRVAEKDNPITGSRTCDVVDKLLRIGNDVWIPAVTREVQFVSVRSLGKEVSEGVTEFAVLSLKINEHVGRDEFRLPLPLQTTVINEALDSYKIGGDIGARLSSWEDKFEESDWRSDAPRSGGVKEEAAVGPFDLNP